MRRMGVGTAGAEAADQQTRAGAQDLSLPLARSDDQVAEPGLGTDITYVPIGRGFLYLVAVIDWASRALLCSGCRTPWTRRSGGGGRGRAGPIRQTGDLQHRPGQAIHRLGLHRRARKDAEAAFDAFVETYGVKYEKAAECLKKDRDPLLAFYDFPAEHWKHLRTSNPIESTFATVRHRTIRSKGFPSNRTALAMVFKPVEGAQKTWRRLDSHNQLPKIIRGVNFTDRCEVIATPGYLQSQIAAA